MDASRSPAAVDTAVDEGGWGRTGLEEDEVAVVEESADGDLSVVESGPDPDDEVEEQLPSRVEIQAAARAEEEDPPSFLDRIRGMFN